MMSVDSTPHLFEIHPGTQTFLSFFKVAFSNSSPGFLKIFQRNLKKKKNLRKQDKRRAKEVAGLIKTVADEQYLSLRNREKISKDLKKELRESSDP